MTPRVLVLNAGSSSLKFAVFEGARRVHRGAVSGIGLGDGAPDHPRALQTALDEAAPEGLRAFDAVAHRIVHGGPRYERSTRIDVPMRADLGRIASLDPGHMPAALAILDEVSRRAPEVPQIACFDTAFHRAMPPVARRLPLPREYEADGLQRYGFHGLSYTFLLEELARIDPAAARGRVLLAHLGSGASLAAVSGGAPVETTMGFTPTGGIPMSTRSGDLDPGVMFYLLREKRMSVDALDAMLNHRAGLLGVSETTGDMRTLLAREALDVRAADAVAMFCHHARKSVGALAASIGGVDTLIFSGGIGERSSVVRARICAGLEHLGVHLATDRNLADAPVISRDGARVTARVIRTDEESILARDTLRILEGPQ